MDIYEKSERQLTAFFEQASLTGNNLDNNNDDLQKIIYNSTAKTKITHDWSFAPTIPYISELVTVYKQEPKDIVIYGAGFTVGEDTLLDLKISRLSPKCFCDSDSKKWGTDFCGYPVISPDELVQNYKTAYIVISSIWLMFNIFDQLIDMGIPCKNIYIPYIEPVYNKKR